MKPAFLYKRAGAHPAIPPSLTTPPPAPPAPPVQPKADPVAPPTSAAPANPTPLDFKIKMPTGIMAARG